MSAIIAMARHLRIEVIAEGIEAYRQGDILRTLGCHQGRGHLYARPLVRRKSLAMLGGRFPDAAIRFGGYRVPIVLKSLLLNLWTSTWTASFQIPRSLVRFLK